MSVRGLAVAFSLVLAGCPSDLDHFELVCDGAHETTDGGGGGGGGGDGQGLWDGVVAQCACGAGDEIPAGCAACDCPLPAVLMLVDSRSGSAPTDGKVMLYSLATQSACGELTGGDTLPSSVSSVGWIPPATIAVGSDPDVIRAINPRWDDYRWVYDPPCCAAGWPRDVFPLDGPAGETYTAAAYTLDQGYDDIRYVEVYDGSGGRVDGWQLNDTGSPLKLGLSIYGMTRSPLDAKELLVFKSGTYAAATISTPWAGEDVYPATYYPALPSGTPDTIRALRQGDLSRVVWVSGAFSDEPESIYYTSDSGSGPMVAGPLRCDAQCAAPARFFDAVPDPTDTTGVVAVCFADETGGRAHVVRLNRAGECEKILDGDALPPLQRPIRLDIAQ